jgi:hypothetical protein
MGDITSRKYPYTKAGRDAGPLRGNSGAITATRGLAAAWSNAGMSTTDSHLELLRRWLRGEVVNGHVGIRVHGGPLDKRTKIVQLDGQGEPPERLRSRRGGGEWHLYLLTGEASAWAYLYSGEDGT